MNNSLQTQSKSVIADSHSLLAKHARSFRWAAFFLPRSCHDDAAVVYAFCRIVDDAVDEAPNREQALRNLEQLEAELNGTREASSFVAEFKRVASRTKIPLAAVSELLQGMQDDLDAVRLQTEGELMRYCYRVAGTVGIMMCGVLGVKNAQALAHAIDLGIGMQLTNICRDIKEDTARNRVYIPATWLDQAGISQEQLISGQFDKALLAPVVQRSLEVAEQYYKSADRGLHYIPILPRLAIFVAKAIYRSIGLKLQKKHHYNAWHGRTIVGPGSKVIHLLGAIFDWSTAKLRPRKYKGVHEKGLHKALQGLPGAND